MIPKDIILKRVGVNLELLEILASIICMLFLMRFAEMRSLSLVYAAATEKVGLTLKEFLEFDLLEITAENVCIVIVAWFADSYLGKLNVLFIATGCGFISNLLLLPILLPVGGMKKAFLYMSWILFPLYIATFRLIFLALFQDQIKLPENRKLLKNALLVYLCMLEVADTIIDITYNLLKPYYSEHLYIGIVINLIAYIVCLILLIRLKNKLKIRYYFQVVEKVIGCWIKALILKYSNQPNSRRRNSSNYIDKVEDYHEDIKQAAQQQWMLLRVLICLFQYIVIAAIMRRKLYFFAAWSTNKNKWLINYRIDFYLCLFTLTSFLLIDLLVIPALQRYFNVLKTEIGQMMLSFIILAALTSVMTYYQFKLEKSVPLLPHGGCAQIRIYNGLDSTVKLKSKWFRGVLEPFQKRDILYIKMKGAVKTEMNVTFRNKTFISTEFEAIESESTSYIICNNGFIRVNETDYMRYKVSIDTAFLTIITCHLNETVAILEIFNSTGLVKSELLPLAGARTKYEGVTEARIKVSNKTYTTPINTEPGGHYVLMVSQNFYPKLFTIAERAPIDIGLLFIPMILYSCQDASFALAMYRFIGFEIPAIIRTIALCSFSFTKIFSGNILEYLFHGNVGVVIDTFYFIVVFLFFFSGFALYLYTLFNYTPFQYGEQNPENK